MPLTKAWNCEVYYSKDYHWVRRSFLSHPFENNKLLILLVNILMLIFIFITLEILLSGSEYMDYLTNQILLHLFYPDWFHVFTILAFLLTYLGDYDASVVCNQLQENGLLHPSCEEYDSIMQSIYKTSQVDLPLVITNWEFDPLINPYDHDFVSDDCHSTYHFPMSTSNDFCFTPFDLFGSTSHYLGTCQAVEALPHSLMVMSNHLS